MKYRFASCCLDTDRHVFERDGKVLHLEPQVFDLLLVLVRSAGDLVTHDRLVAEVWHGLTVSNATISARINAARRAVGDDGRAQGIIETVARRGFRLAARVETEATSPTRPKSGEDGTSSEALPTLAVLPFRYLGDQPKGLLAEGIVDEITTALSRVHEFEVIAWQSASALGRDQFDIPTAAQMLGADYLVEGTIHHSGERLRVGVGLLDSAGHILWRGRFDEKLDDVLDLQDRIAMAVAGQLPVKLRDIEIAHASQPGRQADAARTWILRALPHFWTPRPEANLKAIELLSRAIEINRSSARALAYKAWAVAQQVTYMWSKDVEADRAEASLLASRATEHVDDDAPALVAIGAAYSLVAADLTPAFAFVRRALELDSNNAWGHMRLGWTLVYDGQPAEALEAFDRARRLSPLDPFLYNMRIGTAAAYADLGEVQRAIYMVHEALTHAPRLTWAYRLLAGLYGRIGDTEKARLSADKLFAAYPGLTLDQLHKCLPPAVAERNLQYLKGLRVAGLLVDSE